MELAIIGLGKMGSSLALQALDSGIKVFGLTQGKISDELTDRGLIACENLEHLIKILPAPRKIILYIPAGKAVDEYVDKLNVLLSPDDILMDGGNSYWGDSIIRAEKLHGSRIDFLDVGTSGGVSGAREGACFMVGGSKEAYKKVESILELLSSPDSVAHVGPSGSGHLVKLVHNGIEFGMLQAIGEGMALLEKFKSKIPLEMKEILKVYRHGSVIRSWLIDLMEEQYLADGFQKVDSYIEDTGEVNWLVNDALHLEVPIPVISQSVMELFRSRLKDSIDYKSIAMMRHGFGGHPFGKSEYLKDERRTSRIDESFQLN
jgi:6-phosphogluconate dehydrogenase